ncbi:MAG: hypothetical protein KKD44_28810 [Proteobacteria bacterium]|nr:hypothetical protein [Pseudomonadota bacterium]
MRLNENKKEAIEMLKNYDNRVSLRKKQISITIDSKLLERIKEKAKGNVSKFIEGELKR